MNLRRYRRHDDLILVTGFFAGIPGHPHSSLWPITQMEAHYVEHTSSGLVKVYPTAHGRCHLPDGVPKGPVLVALVKYRGIIASTDKLLEIDRCQ